jgi:hypothetical protein
MDHMQIRRKTAERDQPDEDWCEMIALCQAVEAELPDLVPDIVDRIREELPDYTSVPRAEHERHVQEQYRGLLAGLATRMPPTAEETDAARRLGQQRAREGVPVQAMIGAYHVGYREIWNVLLSRAETADGRMMTQLVRLVSVVWTWIRLASSAAAEAHAETFRSQQAAQINLTHRFIDLLCTARAGAEEAPYLARALAFDPAGDFQVVCASASSWTDAQLDRLQVRLGRQRGMVSIGSPSPRPPAPSMCTPTRSSTGSTDGSTSPVGTPAPGTA